MADTVRGMDRPSRGPTAAGPTGELCERGQHGARRMAEGAADLTPRQLLELSTAFRPAKVLLTAVELDLFSVLSEGPLDAEDLRQQLGLHPRTARDLFDNLD